MCVYEQRTIFFNLFLSFHCFVHRVHFCRYPTQKRRLRLATVVVYHGLLCAGLWHNSLNWFSLVTYINQLIQRGFTSIFNKHSLTRKRESHTNEMREGKQSMPKKIRNWFIIRAKSLGFPGLAVRMQSTISRFKPTTQINTRTHTHTLTQSIHLHTILYNISRFSVLNQTRSMPSFEARGDSNLSSGLMLLYTQKRIYDDETVEPNKRQWLGYTYSYVYLWGGLLV